MALILLVESDEAIRRATTVALVSDGHDVTATASYAQAMAVLEAEAPDLLITAVTLPDQSGLTLARRSKAAHPHIQVWLATAAVTWRARSAAHAAGAGRVFDWSRLTLGELREHVRQGLRVRGHRQGLARSAPTTSCVGA